MTALLKIRDDIIKAMKKGAVTLMVLADHSKTFDIINALTVVQKMSRLNLGRKFMHWIVSYLSGRHLDIQIDDKTSQSLNDQFRVPQGSILGTSQICTCHWHRTPTVYNMNMLMIFIYYLFAFSTYYDETNHEIQLKARKSQEAKEAYMADSLFLINYNNVINYSKVKRKES